MIKTTIGYFEKNFVDTKNKIFGPICQVADDKALDIIIFTDNHDCHVHYPIVSTYYINVFDGYILTDKYNIEYIKNKTNSKIIVVCEDFENDDIDNDTVLIKDLRQLIGGMA